MTPPLQLQKIAESRYPQHLSTKQPPPRPLLLAVRRKQVVGSQEPPPRQMGRFLLRLGVALMVVFLVVFDYHGHKASLMKNSGSASPSIFLQTHTV